MSTFLPVTDKTSFSVSTYSLSSTESEDVNTNTLKPYGVTLQKKKKKIGHVLSL